MHTSQTTNDGSFHSEYTNHYKEWKENQQRMMNLFIIMNQAQKTYDEQFHNEWTNTNTW